MLRVKNAASTINQCLNKLSELVDEIVIVDNESTDGTFEKYANFSKIVIVKRTIGFNEGRDKIFAHKLAVSRKPDWIVWIDADEVFENALNRLILEKYMHDEKLNLVNFRLFHFWKSNSKIRVDGAWLRYTSFPQRNMWRENGSAYFSDTIFHNGGIKGVNGKSITSEYRLKHFGYLNSIALEKKYRQYEKLKDDKLSGKTMSLNANRLRLIQWRELRSKTANYIFISLFKLFWDCLQKYFVLKDFLISASKLPKQKENYKSDRE